MPTELRRLRLMNVQRRLCCALTGWTEHTQMIVDLTFGDGLKWAAATRHCGAAQQWTFTCTPRLVKGACAAQKACSSWNHHPNISEFHPIPSHPIPSHALDVSVLAGDGISFSPSWYHTTAAGVCSLACLGFGLGGGFGSPKVQVQQQAALSSQQPARLDAAAWLHALPDPYVFHPFPSLYPPAGWQFWFLGLGRVGVYFLLICILVIPCAGSYLLLRRIHLPGMKRDLEVAFGHKLSPKYLPKICLC